ncbi:MAG: MFS transporter [Kiritimatiellia bacterium]
MNAKSAKWVTLGLLSCAFFFHQADRALFGLLTIPIQQELALTDLQIGWINAALFCTLAVATPFAGILGDRFSRKWIITCSLLFWSLMTACTGLVGGYCGLVFFRSIATGGGESFYGPSAYALLAAHHRETRAIAFSIHQSALYVGLMFSGAIVAWALHLFGGWRPVFFAFGGLGLLLGLVFCFALGDVRRERRAADAGGGPAAKRPPVGRAVAAFLTNPAALCAMGGYIAIVFANNAYMSWGPKFFATKFDGLGIAAAGFGSMFWHHLPALAAIIVSGFLTDFLVRRNPRSRLLLQGVTMILGAPALVWIGCASTVVSAWTAVAAYGLFRGLSEVNTHPSLFDVIEPSCRSTAEGVMNLITFLIGSTAPLIFGALSSARGVRGLEIGFGGLGVVYVVGAALLLLSYRLFFRRYAVREEAQE